MDLAEPTLQPSNKMQPVLHLQAQGVVLTSYFVGSTDPIYQSNPGRHKVGDFGYMDLWYAARHASVNNLHTPWEARPDDDVTGGWCAGTGQQWHWLCQQWSFTMDLTQPSRSGGQQTLSSLCASL